MQNEKKKRYRGFAVLIVSVLLLGLLIGICMYYVMGDEEEFDVLSGEGNVTLEENIPMDNIIGEDTIEDNTTEDIITDGKAINNTTADLPIYCVESLETINLPNEFAIEDYYCTNHVTVGNRYFIDENDVLWGYGSNEFGQLGIGKVDNTDTVYTQPQKIAENVISVDSSCNGYFAIYLTADGELYGMGSNKIGLLGQPYEERISDNDYLKVPEPVLLMEDVAYASAGMHSIVALKKDGTVWWWGEYKSTYATKYNYDFMKHWQIEEEENNPAKMMYIQPKKVLDNCIYASTGNWNGAAITTDGELYTWGLNIFGECGVEVTEDDYVRKPTKVLDDVKMVWFEEIKNGSLEQNISDFTNRKLTYNFTLFAQLKDGTMMAAGKDLGEKEKTIELAGDILTPSTEKYSDTFVPIVLEEYSEAACRAKLNKLKWGMTVSEAEQVLDQEGLYYLELLSAVEGTENELAVSELYVEDQNYILEFDEERRLHTIRLQNGGSRNGRFTMGMTQEEVLALIDCDLQYEDDDSIAPIRWTKEPIDDIYYGFKFYGEPERTLTLVIETDSLEDILTDAPIVDVVNPNTEE